MNIAYNADCLAAMREMPDNAFDLAVVDPPYGDGLTDHGGGDNSGTDSVSGSTDTNCQQIRIPRKEPIPPWGGERLTSQAADAKDRVHRTGGTWAEKFGKKSSRGTSPRNRNTSSNCFASHAPRSSGGAITSICRRLGAFLCGAKRMFRSKGSLWLLLNMRGLASIRMRWCLNSPQSINRGDSIRRRNRLSCIRGFTSTSQKRATAFSTHISDLAQAGLPRMMQGWTLWATRLTRHTSVCKKNALRGTRHRQACLLTNFKGV